MFEVLKEKIKNSLKEMVEKTNKKLEEINKSLKQNQEKPIKQMKEMIQYLKTEIETIKKKTQDERIIETEIMRKRSETTNASMNSRIQEMEEIISSTEDTIEEIDSLVKKIKSNKSLTQNIQEIWDTMKRPNLRKTGIEEGEV